MPRVDELRGQTKLKGKPTPEQLEELRGGEGGAPARRAGAGARRRRRASCCLTQLPNPPDDSAPDGFADEDAEELRRVGEPPQLADPKEHTEVGRFDMERAARLSGSRFGYMLGDTALLAFALYRFALDRAAAHGHVPMLPPVLVREEAMYGTGFFPTDRSNIYAIESDELYLTGTSEVALAGLHMGEVLDAGELPLRYAAFSTNFRREAGAAGKDTRGMFRVHQFNKVELFTFCDPSASADEHERILAIEEEILQALRIPYRVVNVAAGDLGAPGDEEVRLRGLVPVPGALPRADVDLEHDGLPGAPARHPLPRGQEPRAGAHAERDRDDRPHPARDPRELPGRGAGRAAPVRRARYRQPLTCPDGRLAC